MNIEQLRTLTPEDQRRYIAVEKRYTSEAWEFIKNWCQVQVEAAEKRAAHAEDWPMNRMNMGAVGILNLLLSQEAMDYQEFDLLVSENDEEEPYAGDLQL